MIRSVPANASDSLYCMLLASNAVHGAMVRSDDNDDDDSDDDNDDDDSDDDDDDNDHDNYDDVDDDDGR